MGGFRLRRACVSAATLVMVLAALSSAQQADVTRFLNATDPGKDAIGDDLPPRAVMRFGTHRFQHPSSVADMALSPDGRTVVTLDSDFLIGWDAGNGKELWREKWSGVHGNSVSAASYCRRYICFGDDSDHFYTTGVENQILTWNAREGSVEKTDLRMTSNPFLKGKEDRLSSIDIASDGKRFAVGGHKGIGIVRANGEQEWLLSNVPLKALDEAGDDRLEFGGDYAMAIFSPDDKLLAAVLSQEPKKLKLIDVETADEVAAIELTDRLIRMTFSPDGKSIYATERDCGIRSYSVETKKLNWELVLPPDPKEAESYTSAIACSSDGKTLAVGAPIGPKYWIYLVDAVTGKEISILKSDMWKPWAVQFTKDNQTLYSNGWDGGIRRWDVATGEERELPQGIRASSSVTYAPDGKKIAFTDGSGDVRIVDASTGIQLRKISPEETTGSALLFSQDGATIHMGGGKDDSVGVESWNLDDGKRTHQWQWPKGEDSHSSVNELATTPDGRYLAAAVFRQGATYLWDTTTSKQIAKLKHSSVYGLDFSPDGKRLATVGWDKQLRIWGTSSGELVKEYDVPSLLKTKVNGMFAGNAGIRMYTVRFSPDGERLAIAHMDGMSGWDITDLEKPEELFFSKGSFIFGALDYSPSGRLIAAGERTGQVALYDAMTGAPKLVLGKHSEHVFTVRFGGDDSSLVSGGGSVSYLWDTTMDE